VKEGETRFLCKDTRIRNDETRDRTDGGISGPAWAIPNGCATLKDVLHSGGNATAPIPTCSAKIARWNAIGVQGRLLARCLVRIADHAFAIASTNATDDISFR